jgi:hypothetical protein
MQATAMARSWQQDADVVAEVMMFRHSGQQHAIAQRCQSCNLPLQNVMLGMRNKSMPSRLLLSALTIAVLLI